MGPVWTPTQLARLSNDCVDALREDIIQRWEGDLSVNNILVSQLRRGVGREGATGVVEEGERMIVTHFAARQLIIRR